MNIDEILEGSGIDELAELTAEQRVLEERMRSMEERRAAVSDVVYERVRRDYEARLAELAAKAEPLRVDAREAYRRVAEAKAEVEEGKRVIELEQEELKFRHELGELTDDELEPKLASCTERLTEIGSRLEGLESATSRLVAAVGSVEELEAGADDTDDEASDEADEVEADPSIGEESDDDGESAGEGEGEGDDEEGEAQPTEDSDESEITDTAETEGDPSVEPVEPVESVESVEPVDADDEDALDSTHHATEDELAPSTLELEAAGVEEVVDDGDPADVEVVEPVDDEVEPGIEPVEPVDDTVDPVDDAVAVDDGVVEPVEGYETIEPVGGATEMIAVVDLVDDDERAAAADTETQHDAVSEGPLTAPTAMYEPPPPIPPPLPMDEGATVVVPPSPPAEEEMDSSAAATRIITKPRLVLLSDEGQPQEFVVGTQPITVGRSPDNDIQLIQEAISRHHTEIGPGLDGFEVRDMGSENGTWVNGERVEQRTLQHGDIIQVGTKKLFYKEA